MAEVKLYTTPYCPYCIRAKSLLDSIGQDYEDVDVEGDRAMRTQLAAENGGYRTVPMIFINGQFIGGYSELSAMHSSGALEKALKA